MNCIQNLISFVFWCWCYFQLTLSLCNTNGDERQSCLLILLAVRLRAHYMIGIQAFTTGWFLHKPFFGFCLICCTHIFPCHIKWNFKILTISIHLIPNHVNIFLLLTYSIQVLYTFLEGESTISRSKKWSFAINHLTFTCKKISNGAPHFGWCQYSI